MTATKIDRVRSDNSVSNRHPNANETAGTTPEQDPQTNRIGHDTKQPSGVTTKPDIVKNGWFLEEVEDSLEWHYSSNTDLLRQTGCTTVGPSTVHQEPPAKGEA